MPTFVSITDQYAMGTPSLVVLVANLIKMERRMMLVTHTLCNC